MSELACEHMDCGTGCVARDQRLREKDGDETKLEEAHCNLRGNGGREGGRDIIMEAPIDGNEGREKRRKEEVEKRKIRKE